MTNPLDIKLNHDDVRSAIAKIRALNLRAATTDEVKELLKPLFQGYVVKAPKLSAGLKLFRSRIGEKQKNIKDFLYPPAELVRLGRANQPMAPVLYCSSSSEGALFESKPSAGATVGIAQWVTKTEALVNHVGFTPRSFTALNSRRTSAGWETESTEAEDDQANHDVAEFLADVFTQRVPADGEYLYKITAAVSEMLFADDIFNGLIYPTVAMRANADNIALKARYVDEHLQFIKAEFLRVDAVREFGFDITIIDTAKDLASDGAIQWRGRPEHWVLHHKGDRLILTAESGRWVARDVAGNIVEPE